MFFINQKIPATENTEGTEKTHTSTGFSTSTILATPFPLLRRLDVSIKPGDFGEDCLSAKREFRSRPD
jgi:hypothetical protein